MTTDLLMLNPCSYTGVALKRRTLVTIFPITSSGQGIADA